MEKLIGKIQSGLGDFGMRMQTVDGLSDAYFRKTGINFFPGTLNVELDQPWSMPASRMRLEKEEYSGTVSVNMYPCRVNGKEAFVLRTDNNESGQGSHPKTILEIASDVKLRDFFRLEDGDTVTIEF